MARWFEGHHFTVTGSRSQLENLLLKLFCVLFVVCQTFVGNQVTCLKILPQQIQAIVDLAAFHLEKVPEFLDLLNDIVKVSELGLTLKRNQAYVMKYLMQVSLTDYLDSLTFTIKLHLHRIALFFAKTKV